MALTNKTIRRLSGGVSEQPDSQRQDSQCTEQINFMSDVVDGLVKRPGSEFLGELEPNSQTPYLEGDENVFTHEIIREGDTKLLLSIANGKLSLIDLADGSKIRVNDAAGTEITTAAQTYLNYSNASILTHPYAAVTIADTTFVLNKEIAPAMKAATTGVGTYSDEEIKRGMIFIREGAYNAEYSLEAVDSDGTIRTMRIQTSDGLGAGNVVDSKTDNICAAIHACLQSAASSGSATLNTTGYPSHADENTGIVFTWSDSGGTYNSALSGPVTSFHRFGSTISWFSTYAGDAAGYAAATNKIEISDSYGDTLADSFNEEKSSFQGLPLTAPNNFLVKITGSPESSVDDYYVKFVCDDPQAGYNDRGRGKWVETYDSGLEYKLNGAYMPHQLVKVSASVYQFKPVEWDDKTVGDAITDPNPSFIDKKINDIFFFKSRLGLLSGENVILTELDDPYNFWRTTVTQVLASDRIDIQSSVNEITELRFAVPFANQMVIFSDRTQFIIAFGSQGLTPETASLAQISAYECSKNVSPIAVDNNIIFVQERSSSSAVYEMFPTGTTELSFEAQEITQQIPSYLQGKVVRLVGSSLSNSIILQTDNANNELYVYKFFNQGRERILSSWFKYSFPVLGIKGIHYVDDKCYKVNSLATTAAPTVDDTHVLDFFRLDNTEIQTHAVDLTIPHTSMALVQIDGSGDTDVRLPLTGGTTNFIIDDYFARNTTLVAFDDQNVLAVLKAPDTGSNFDMKITGDWTSKTFYVGILFDAEYEFSKQFLKRGDAFGKEIPVVNGRTTVKWCEVYVSDTQFLKIEVSYPSVNKDTTTRSISGNITGGSILGDQGSETGTLRTVVASRNDVPVIKLLNSTHQVAKINGASFELMHTSKLRGRN